MMSTVFPLQHWDSVMAWRNCPNRSRQAVVSAGEGETSPSLREWFTCWIRLDTFFVGRNSGLRLSFNARVSTNVSKMDKCSCE